MAGRAAAGAVLAVPVGSTEQHGPHLPLSTDTDIAVALARRLAGRRPHVLVAPALAYGSAGEHAGFAGTLSIGQEALELVLVELGRSAADWVGRTVLICAHGGNAEPVTRAVNRLRGEGRDTLAWSPRWDAEPHAGRHETSMQLALDPARVRMTEAVAGDPRPLAQLLPLLRAGGVRAVSPSGVLGDPRPATVAEGEALLDRLVDDLVRAVDGWEAR